MQTLERVLRNLFQDKIDAELAAERAEGKAEGRAEERKDFIQKRIAIGWNSKDAAEFVGEV